MQNHLEEIIDCRQFFFKVVSNWYLFVLCLVFFLLIAFSFNRYSPALSFSSFAVFSSMPSIFKISSTEDWLIDSIEESSNEILESMEQDTLIVVMSNADFEGLSQKLIGRTKDG